MTHHCVFRYVKLQDFSSNLTFLFCFQKCARKGISQVVLSRVVMAAPGMSKLICDTLL